MLGIQPLVFVEANYPSSNHQSLDQHPPTPVLPEGTGRFVLHDRTPKLKYLVLGGKCQGANIDNPKDSDAKASEGAD